jgi:hypothetical protein
MLRQRLRQFRDSVAPDGVYIYDADDPKEEIIFGLLAKLGTIVCIPDNGRGDAVGFTKES